MQTAGARPFSVYPCVFGHPTVVSMQPPSGHLRAHASPRPFSPLQTLSIENQHLKQRQAALNATLDMQQQLQAAAAAGGGSLGGGSAGQPSASEAGESAELRSLGPASSSIGPSHGQEDEGSELDESAVDSLLAELAASAAEDASWARAAELVPPAALGGTPWQAAAEGASAGCWFFSASLAQHVQWYRCQVCWAGRQTPAACLPTSLLA